MATSSSSLAPTPAAAAASSSLKDVMKHTIKQLVIEDAKSKMRRKYSLIVADDVTIQILHHCFKMHELNDMDIGVVVNVKYPRERVKVSPIYFLSGNFESVKHMVDDYKDVSKARYSAPVHAYFCSPLEPRSLTLVQGSNIAKYLGTFSEVHCDFLVAERLVFTLNRPEAFGTLYLHSADQRMAELSSTAQQLVGVCLALKQAPYIRYSSSSKLAHSLAQLFDKRFSEVRTAVKGWTPDSERATLLIFDRADDVLSPLLHDLTFQPMVMDLLHDDVVDAFAHSTPKPAADERKAADALADGGGADGAEEEGEEVEVKVDSSSTTTTSAAAAEMSEDAKVRVPDECDEVWAKYRHLFFGEVIRKLPAEFREWREASAVAKFKDKKGAASLTGKDLLRAAQDMPQYKAKIKQYNANIELANRVKTAYSKLGLLDVISLEQDIAAGIDGDGRKVGRSEITKQFTSQILMAELSTMPMALKTRLLLVYLIAQGGVKPKVRKALMERGGFGPEVHRTCLNLAALGVTLQAAKPGDVHHVKEYWSDLQKHAKSLAETEEMIRFVPYLQWALDRHIKGSLDKKHFPWIAEPIAKKASARSGGSRIATSFRRHKKSVTSAAAETAPKKTGPKVIVFVVGGASYTELRVCYDLSQKYETDIYIGSTQMLSPQGFIDQLQAKTAGIAIDD